MRQTGSGLIMLLLVVLILEVMPCIGTSCVDAAAPTGPESVCGGTEYETGAFGEDTLLRSEPPVPIPPSLVRAAALLSIARLPEGHRPPIERPPRFAT